MTSEPSDPFSCAPGAAPGGSTPKHIHEPLPAPSSWEGHPWRGPFVQGSQFLPLEAFAVVTVPFGLGVPCSVGRTQVPLRLPHPPGTSQVSFEQELMDHGSWFMALGNASALLKSPITIYWFFCSPAFPPSPFPHKLLRIAHFQVFFLSEISYNSCKYNPGD